MIKMFMSSKLFAQYMSIGIVRIQNTGERAAIYTKNTSRDWLEKKQSESVVSTQSLS